MNKIVSRLMLVLTLVALVGGALALDWNKAAAASHTFNVSVYHGINGRSLGLSKELPVIAEVYKDGDLITQIPLSFKGRFTADLEPGNYMIMVKSVELNAYVDSMTVGPVDLPAGIDLRLKAKLGAGKTPILNVRVK